MPIALGCALYPEIGSSVYSRAAFAPAENNLRVLSVFLFLMYFTMPLGTALLAAGRQRAWAIVQSLCVVVSAALDPILVPWFQRRTGNGGLGICTASVISEIIVVVCGVCLIPRGFFDRQFWRSLFFGLVSALVMVAVARALHGFNSFLAAPVAVSAYAVALRLTGGVGQTEVDAVREVFLRKFRRRA
jgi:Na+-driven multidrug efflux pump